MIFLNKVGYIENTYEKLEDCPPNGWKSDTSSKLVIKKEFVDGLVNLKVEDTIHVLWWFDKAPRNILKNHVGNDCFETGVFAMRSPHRPNPIALSLCKVKKIEYNIITVIGIEALNGSPIIDIKKAIGYEGVIL